MQKTPNVPDTAQKKRKRTQRRARRKRRKYSTDEGDSDDSWNMEKTRRRRRNSRRNAQTKRRKYAAIIASDSESSWQSEYLSDADNTAMKGVEYKLSDEEFRIKYSFMLNDPKLFKDPVVKLRALTMAGPVLIRKEKPKKSVVEIEAVDSNEVMQEPHSERGKRTLGVVKTEIITEGHVADEMMQKSTVESKGMRQEAGVHGNRMPVPAIVHEERMQEVAADSGERMQASTVQHAEKTQELAGEHAERPQEPTVELKERRQEPTAEDGNRIKVPVIESGQSMQTVIENVGMKRQLGKREEGMQKPVTEPGTSIHEHIERENIAPELVARSEEIKQGPAVKSDVMSEERVTVSKERTREPAKRKTNERKEKTPKPRAKEYKGNKKRSPVNREKKVNRRRHKWTDEELRIYHSHLTSDPVLVQRPVVKLPKLKVVAIPSK